MKSKFRDEAVCMYSVCQSLDRLRGTTFHGLLEGAEALAVAAAAAAEHCRCSSGRTTCLTLLV